MFFLRKSVLVVGFSLISFYAFCQKQNNSWYFGNLAALDFNGGGPAIVAGSVMNAIEGSCSVSNPATGALLFYTDGETVWNSNNAAMPNGTGLNGTSNSSQSALIVPDPGNNNEYYIFTTGAEAGGSVGTYYPGVCYSKVDMTLSAGSGDVTTKNTALVSPAVEKLTATKNSSGTGYWVITHEWNSDAFYVYPVTAAGVGAPVISNVGIVNQNAGSGASREETTGCMKTSPDGSKLAVAFGHAENKLQIFDFNISTGVVSTAITVAYAPVAGQRVGPYGVSFSNDGSKLYVSHANFDNLTSTVYQYDMSAGSAMAIIASQVSIANNPLGIFGSMQLATDCRIYITKNPDRNLDAITNPNAGGAACNYVNNVITFPVGTGTQLGLPNLIDDIFDANPTVSINDTTICQRGSINCNPVFSDPPDSVRWDFDDPSSGAANSSLLLNPVHQFNTAGTYHVMLISAFRCVRDTIYRTVTVDPKPVINLGNDTSLCSGQSLQLTTGVVPGTILWSTNATTQSITVNTTGNYSVTVTNNICLSRDTISVSFLPQPVVNLGNDTVLCNGQQLTLSAGNPGANYLWSSSATTSTISVTTSGNYSVTVTNGNCMDKDTIAVSFVPQPVANLGNDTTLCNGQQLTLNAGNPGAGYLWSTNATTQTINIASAGTYIITVTIGSCVDKDTIIVNYITQPSVNLGNDTTLCTGQPLQLNAGNPGFTYVWSNSATSQTINVTNSGNYSVSVSNQQCIDKDTIQVTFVNQPAVNLGNDTTVCSGNIIVLNAGNPGMNYLWSNSLTTQTINVSSAGTYIVTVSNGGCSDKDTIAVSFDVQPVVNLGNDSSLCTGQQIVLNAGNAGMNYVWSDNSTSQSLTVNSAGTYSVTVSNNNCIDTDVITINYINVAINLGNDTALCAGQQLVLDAGSQGINYQWSTNATSQTINVNSSGTYTATISQQQCSAEDSIRVTFNQQPVVSLGNDTTLCPGQSLVLNAANAGMNYLWSDNSTTQSISVNSSGLYFVEVTNANCFDSDSILISFVQPVVSLGNDTTLCAGQTIQLNIITSGGVYQWSTGATTQSISLSTAGVYTATVSIGNCSSTDSIVINYISVPTVNLGNDTILCLGQQLILDAGYPGLVYQWSTNATTQNIMVNNTSVYTASVYNQQCKGEDSIRVTFYQPPVIDLGNDTSICPGQSILLDAGFSGLSYLWNTGDTSQSIAVIDSGWYDVTAGNYGCLSSDSLLISFKPSPYKNLGVDTVLCYQQTTIVDAGNPGATYLWSDGDQTRIKLISATGTYSVIITDTATGCSIQDTIVISDYGCTVNLFVPKGFMPGTGLANSIFRAYGFNITSYELSVYNRWGQLIFYTTNLESGWNGTFNGKICQQGAYAYVVKYTGIGENAAITKEVKSGTVTLIR